MESDDHIGETFDPKMISEKHFHPISRSVSQRHGILIKSGSIFRDRFLIGLWFWILFLLVLQYCPTVWCSAAETHVKLLGRVVCGVCFLTNTVVCGVPE